MSATVELQIVQICIALVQVFSLWILVFCALRIWRKERMTEYEYHTLLAELQEGKQFPLPHYRRAARYAARHDSGNAERLHALAESERQKMRRKAHSAAPEQPAAPPVAQPPFAQAAE